MASMNLDEKANFTRLSRLLVDKGTEALRNTLDSLHPSANLPAVLNANRTALLKLKPRVINDTQWDLLFPPSGNPPNSKTFDVTLLTVFLRNICGLPPPATGWNTMPPETDRSPQANVTRIKLLRNQIYAHVSSTEVDKAAFENLWQKVTEALEIDDLKTCPLGPEEENYVQNLKEWVLKEDDCKNILDDLKTNVRLIQQQLIQSDSQRQNDMQQLTTNVTEEIRQGIQQLCPSNSMESKVESQIFDSKESKVGQEHTSNVEEQLLQKLAKHNFKSKIRSKVRLFYPGTREWLLRKLDNWFITDEKSRLLLVTAGPGFGKSVFAAKVCELFNGKGKFAACHFCDFSDSNLKDPMIMLQSLASHMSENVPGFKEKLLDQLNRPHKVRSLKDAFQIYLQNPLDELDVEPRLIVIDGLDESATDDKSDMVKLIADYFPDLPKCVKVLVTSRPELSLQILDHIQIIEIDQQHLNNECDLLKYLEDCFQSLAPKDLVNSQMQAHSICWAIVEKCEGSFLYAFHFQHELRKRTDLDTITVEEMVDFLPEGMGSIYNAYFRRLEIELEATINKKPDLFKVLELFVAANKPLPLKFLARALDLNPDCREMKRIINKVNEVLSCLLYVSNDVVTVFHKSIYDWLLANGYEDHEYSVKIHDGKKRLWQICEQIFEEIKRNVISGFVRSTNEVIHALEYGHEYLLACSIKNNFYWLVDMIIVHVLCTVHPKSISHLQIKWKKVLQSDVTISLQLRQRISWHFIEVSNMKIKDQIDPSCSYLKSVLNHSPEGCFTDDERKIAEEILAKFHRCVKHDLVQMKSLKPLLVAFFPSSIIAVGVSSIKQLAAVALKDGTICVLSLPELVKLFQYSTGYERISCCTFSPDDTFVLYGKLGTALSIVEEKEIPFFKGKVERFKSCSFSPKGRKLVTNDGSNTVKLWDVARQSLLSILCAGVPLKCCSFSKTGLFIIAYTKDVEDVEDSYCVWNAITFQRVDLRSLSSYRLKKKDGFQSSETCKRCFSQAREELIPSKGLGSSTGKYNDVDCILCMDGQTLHVMESIHLTTLAIWGIFIEHFKCCLFFVGITAIKDDLWLYGDEYNLIIYITVPPKENQSCLSRPTLVLWCSFSPDGTRLASCTSDGFIDLWYVDTSQVYQHFRSNIGTSSAACWWSEKYLFVCHIRDGIPSLSLYPVDEHFNILITEMLLIPLCSLVNDFLPFSGILDFSEGYISFGCGETKPVKVIDVNKMDYPKIVFLPGMEPMMSIAVSTGASLILGNDGSNLTIWKRNEAVPALYDIPTVYRFENPFFSFSGCCFSEDSKFVVSFVPNLLTMSFFDVDTDVCVTKMIGDGCDIDVRETEVIGEGFFSMFADATAEVFSTNKVTVLVTSNLIKIFDMKSRSSFHWHLTDNSVIHSKLSPKGNILA
ncbi:E3 ubiquitin- ligase DZIP3, partial [Paramuricea clavata]